MNTELSTCAKKISQLILYQQMNHQLSHKTTTMETTERHHKETAIVTIKHQIYSTNYIDQSKACLKRWVLTSFLNETRDSAILIERGRSFQSLGATLGNALSPKACVLVFRITRRWESTDQRDGDETRIVRKSERQEGACPFRHL